MATAQDCGVRVGQVWEDTYFKRRHDRWLVRVMKLNEKSARVEPCEDNGWFMLAGYEWQYRMEFSHFERGRMRLVADLDRESGAWVIADQGFARGWLLTRLTLLLVTGLAGVAILEMAIHA